MNTQLFIENYEIELNDEVQFLLNKQFEKLSNPTVIKADWSKTVSIPFTEKNNKIFGYIYRPDRMIVGTGSADSYRQMGMYFDPTKKLDFRLVYNSFVLIEGFAKMNEVVQSNGKGSYNITLLGQLGKVIQQMQKITFDTATTETDYLIDGSQYIDEYINKNLVAQSWYNGSQSTLELKKKTDSGYFFADIIGFAPNNSFSDDFEYDTFQVNTNESKPFTDVLGDAFTEATGVSPDTAIPNGMLPREIGEYRSYNLLPFIYFDKLFQIFQAKAEEVTGYTFDLDPTWFNANNPYWSKLVYMLKPFDVKKGDTKENSYKTYGLVDRWQTDFGGYNTLRSFNLNVNTTNYETDPIYVSSNRFSLKQDANYTAFKMNYVLELETSSAKRTSLKSTNALLVHLVFTGENGHQDIKKYLFTDDLENTFNGASDYTKVLLEEAKNASDDDILRAVFNDFHTLRYKDYGAYADLSVQYKWYTNSYPYSSSVSVSEIEIRMSNTNTNAVVMRNSFRSNSRFILNDLWNNDYNLLNEILNYCKMYRISVLLDDFEKKIIFKQQSQYFNNYLVLDWTEKIDKSKDFTIKPITLENKYVLFNYNDNKTKLGEDYKTKYGINNGEYRLITAYEFNNETKNLFEKITSSITNTDNVLSWSNLYDYHNIVYSFPAEIFVYNKDKDKKQVDMFGAYYFHVGSTGFSTESALHLRSVILSDDTAFQETTNTYFYTQNAELGYPIECYPLLDIVYGDNLCVFNAPKENYTYRNNYSDKYGIYKNFWENYINERYSILNKLITCYMTITPEDYSSFEFNKLVNIYDLLCVVNKIYDYNITANTPTKVDLVTIQDPTAYTDNAFLDRNDELTLSWSSKVYFSGGTSSVFNELGTINSLTNVTFNNGSKEITSNGVMFKIVDNKVMYLKLNSYVEEPDIDFTVTLKNAHNTTSFDCQRYSVYPYPAISASVASIPTNQRTSFEVYFDYTPTEDVVPTFTITLNGGNGPLVAKNRFIDIEASEIMWLDPSTGDERFLTRWTIPFTSNKAIFGTTIANSVTIKVTDAQGWYKSITLPFA